MAVVSDSCSMGSSATVGVSLITVSQLSRYIRSSWGFFIPVGSFNLWLASIRLRSLAVDQLAGWSTAHLSSPADGVLLAPRVVRRRLLSKRYVR